MERRRTLQMMRRRRNGEAGRGDEDVHILDQERKLKGLLEDGGLKVAYEYQE